MQSMQKGLLMSNKYVYESPDGGKTVTRRVIHRESNTVGRSLSKEVNVDKKWFTLDTAKEVMSKQVEEEKLRDKHPALKNAWDEYQLILKMLKENKDG